MVPAIKDNQSKGQNEVRLELQFGLIAAMMPTQP